MLELSLSNLFTGVKDVVEVPLKATVFKVPCGLISMALGGEVVDDDDNVEIGSWVELGKGLTVRGLESCHRISVGSPESCVPSGSSEASEPGACVLEPWVEVLLLLRLFRPLTCTCTPGRMGHLCCVDFC